MAHRIRIVLTDAQHARLRAESERTGLALAELVRRAIDLHHPATGALPTRTEVEAAIMRAAGVWADRPFDGAAYVEALRGGRPLPE